MAELHVLVGLPASRKSTYAQQLATTKDATIVSSDSMREERYGDVNNQDNNVELFEKMHERINRLLSEGRNVVYDATNINRKRRVHLIKSVIKADEYHAHYMRAPLGLCLYNDTNRSREVGYAVIDRMYKNMHIPTILEGWDTVNFIDGNTYIQSDFYRKRFEELLIEDDHDSLFEELQTVVPEFEEICNVPQDSSYHSFSISRHTFYVYKYILDNYKGKRELEMKVAALFHDLGKARCKSFYNYKEEEKRHANFIGHENVSAQLAVTELHTLGYDDEFIKYVVDLIQMHMRPMNMSEKTERNLRGLLTAEQYEDLMFLHEADLSAK